MKLGVLLVAFVDLAFLFSSLLGSLSSLSSLGLRDSLVSGCPGLFELGLCSLKFTRQPSLFGLQSLDGCLAL